MCFQSDRVHREFSLAHSPYRLQYFHLALGIADISHEIFDDGIFLVREFYRIFSFSYDFTTDIDRIFSEVYHFLDRFFFSACECDDPCFEFTHLKWLHHVVISTQIKHRNLIAEKGIRREYDHGRLIACFSDLLYKRTTIHHRHIHIEYDDVIMRMEHEESLFSMDRSLGRISLETQVLDDVGADFWMIFDDQDFHR